MMVVEKPFAQASSSISNTITGIVRYKSVKSENDKLRAENTALKKENTDLQLKRDEYKELKDLSKSFNFAPFTSSSKAVAANIIELDYSKPYVIFTVDAGTDKGIKKNDVVCNGQGLVGKVQEAGSGWAKVSSVLSDGNNISFKVLGKSSITGVVKGNGKNKLTGYLFNQNSRVVEGDKLVTSGIGIYPKGIRIGTVASIAYNDNTQQKDITVRPTVTFSNMDKVAIYL